MTTTRGSGSLRFRGGDQWEVRVSLGIAAVSGRSAVRSVTVRGDLAEAQRQRDLLAAQAEQLPARAGPPLRTLADLLAVWLQAEHDWKPSTWQNYRIAAARPVIRWPGGRRAGSARRSWRRLSADGELQVFLNRRRRCTSGPCERCSAGRTSSG